MLPFHTTLEQVQSLPRVQLGGLGVRVRCSNSWRGYACFVAPLRWIEVLVSGDGHVHTNLTARGSFRLGLVLRILSTLECATHARAMRRRAVPPRLGFRLGLESSSAPRTRERREAKLLPTPLFQ